MPDEAAGATASEPQTLAGRIQLLRRLTTPKGEAQPSYERLAVLIEDATGVKMSGAHIFNVATGKQVNPKIEDVRAFALYFRVPVGYLVGDGGDYRRLETELELLEALKRGGVQQISIEGDSDTTVDLSVAKAVLRQIDKLAVFGDARAGKIVVDLAALEEGQRRTAEEIIADPGLLDSLREQPARTAAALLGKFSPTQLASLSQLLEDPDAVEALAADDVAAVAAALAALSAQSRAAVMAVINQLSNPQDI